MTSLELSESYVYSYCSVLRHNISIFNNEMCIKNKESTDERTLKTEVISNTCIR